MERKLRTYGEEEMCIQDFGGETRKKRNNVEELDVVGQIILKCIRKKKEGEYRQGLSGARQGQVSDSCEHRKNLQVS
jgi:hypothetical protein